MTIRTIILWFVMSFTFGFFREMGKDIYMKYKNYNKNKQE